MDRIESLILSLDHNNTRPPVAQHDTPLPVSEEGLIVHEKTSEPRSETNSGIIVPSLSRHLGFPLMVHPTDSTLHPVDNFYNQHAHLLFLESDISEDNVGTFTAEPVMGNLTIERCDGKDLKAQQLCSLITFVNTHIVENIQRLRTASPQGHHEIMTRLGNIIKPRVFHECFERHRGIPGFEDWDDVENPVDITEEEKNKPACGACFGTEREDGKALFRCGACGWSAYCSKDCQKFDWQNGHQRVCKKNGK